MASPESAVAVTANQQRVYRVGRDQLPLSCPTPEMTLWNSHPRVYLAIEATGRVRCPYCSAEFVLGDAQGGSEGAAAT